MEIRRKFSKKWIGRNAIIYSSAPEKAIVAIVKIRDVIKDTPYALWQNWGQAIDCSHEDFSTYTRNMTEVYGILLDEVKRIGPIPKLQLEFALDTNLVPPQSYCSIDDNVSWRSAVGIAHLLRKNI